MDSLSDSSIESREPKKKAKKKSIKRRAAKTVNSLLKMGNNGQPGTPIATTPFTGENYMSWSRSITTALTAKSQQGFLDGSIEFPSTVEDQVRWVKADLLVRSWILNSLSKEIKQDFVHIETTPELWEGLKLRYQVTKELSSYQLQKNINSLQQGNSTLEHYFSKMKSWWDEFRCINPLPSCDCKIRLNKCCIISGQVEEQDMKKRLAQFLTGLNDSYDFVRTVILGLEIPLDINQTYAFLLSFEKILQTSEVGEEHDDVSAVSFRDLESNVYKEISRNKGKSWNEPKNCRGSSSKSSLVCTYCNMTGHLQEGCFRLIGYPEWFKGRRYSNRAATPFYREEKKPKQEKMSKEAIFMKTKNMLTCVMKQMNQYGDSEASTSKYNAGETNKFQKEVAETRNWIGDLPPDVTMAILQKVGSIDILENVQKVCVSWHKICQDPALWRSIDMNSIFPFYEMPYDLVKMTKHAIDRSCGQLIDINLVSYCDDDLLRYITDRKNQLRCIRLGSCSDITDEGLSEAAKKMPSIEELHLYDGNITSVGLENVGSSCPGLKSLTHNRPGAGPISGESEDDDYLDHSSDEEYHFVLNSEALAISRSMPKLRHLSLIGNDMTNKGLQAILEACPHLESLDLRKCNKVNLSGDLGKRCSSIKTFRHPNESTGDSDSESTIDSRYCPYGESDFFDYDDFTSGFSGMCVEFDSDDEHGYYYYASMGASGMFDYGDFFHKDFYDQDFF